MNGDAVNHMDPDGRMMIGNWEAAIARRGQNIMQTTLGWAATFGMGSLFLMGLEYAAPGALVESPMVVATFLNVAVWYSYFAVKTWWNDPGARKQAAILMGIVTGLFQATHGPVSVGRRAELLFESDLPSAFLMVAAAQGGPEFATLWTGRASYGPCSRIAVYMCAALTNSFAEVVGNGLTVYLQEAAGQLPADTSYLALTAINSINMLVGNTCFYGCMALYDARGRHLDRNFKTVQCKNVWTACRFGARLTSGTLLSQRHGTDAVADGVGSAAIGVFVDRMVGQQILNNLPLYAVHGLFFTGEDALLTAFREETFGMLSRMGSEVGGSPTQPWGVTEDQFLYMTTTLRGVRIERPDGVF
jgi:hypothetical protein